MEIPKKIDPCPIVEAIIEIRFDSETPADAIFGIIYKALKDKYPKYEKLPILQLPEMVRSRDPELIFKPHYKLVNKDFLVQVGPQVFSVINANTYAGWEEFSEKIDEAFDIVSELDVINRVYRIGIRYINFFDFDIFKKINLQVLLWADPLQANQITFRAEVPAGKFLNVLHIVNNAEVNIGTETKKGSVIDIDTMFQDKTDDFFRHRKQTIEEGHLEEKKLFFTLLKGEYLNTLNPKY